MSAARPTRRAVVRGAAWSVPVVAIAATAPAFASSLSATSASASLAKKWGTQSDTYKHVSWDFSITTGGRAVSNVSVNFTYTPNGGGGTGTFYSLDMYTFLPTTGSQWTVTGIPASGGTNTATATIPTTESFAPNTTYTVHTDFSGTDNSTGTLTATVTVTYVGGGSDTLTTLSAGWTQASPGNTEPAPHSSH